MKKIISILLGVVLIFSTFAFVGCAPEEKREDDKQGKDDVVKYEYYVSIMVTRPKSEWTGAYTSLEPYKTTEEKINIENIDYVKKEYYYKVEHTEEDNYPFKRELVFKIHKSDDYLSKTDVQCTLTQIVNGENRRIVGDDVVSDNIPKIQNDKVGTYSRTFGFNCYGSREHLEMEITVEILDEGVEI